MNEASTTLIEQVVRVMRDRGLDPRPLFKGLPFTLEQALATPRIDWDPFCDFLENLAEVTGSLEAFMFLFEELNAGFPLWQGFAQMYINPRELVHLAFQYGRGLYTCCEAWVVDLPDGRIQARQEIHSAYRAIPWLAHATAGLCQGLPRALGLPAATVETTIADNWGEVVITLPPGQTMLGRSAPDFMSTLFVELKRLADVGKTTSTFVPGSIGDPFAQRLTHHTDLQAFAQDALATLRDHLEVRRAALWAREGDGERRLASSGGVEAPLSASFKLSVGSVEVGRLELDSSESISTATRWKLNELLPWFALGLDRARTATALREHEAQLKAQIEQRRLAEETLRMTLEAMPFQAAVFDGEGRLICANTKARAALDSCEREFREAVRQSAEARRGPIQCLTLSSDDALKRVLAFRREARSELRERAVAAADSWRLTPKQTQVLEHLVMGQSNKEIGRALRCAEATVERHVTALLEKSRTDSRLALVARFWGARD